jgi:hypothetical protein
METYGGMCRKNKQKWSAFCCGGAMAYNRGMKQLTLVLPCALPPAELARDLLPALTTPCLANLLTRHTIHRNYTFDNACRVLPHEAWLAHALGLGPAADGAAAGAGVGRAVLDGYGLQADGGTWFVVQPVHQQISQNHMLMAEQRQVALDEADARALFDAAWPYFDEIGQPLLYGDARTWLMRADDWAGLRTASPDAASGQNLSAWMPDGDGARACRKLQNEIQMLWYQHPVNAAREARRQPPVNSFWIWGGSATPAASAVPLHVAAAPGWMAALAQPDRRAATFDTVRGSGAPEALVVLGDLIETGLASEWSAWLEHMQRLERDWFAPLLAAIKDGRLERLTLMLSHRDGYVEFGTSKNAQRKFWRKPSLNNLKQPTTSKQ